LFAVSFFAVSFGKPLRDGQKRPLRPTLDLSQHACALFERRLQGAEDQDDRRRQQASDVPRIILDGASEQHWSSPNRACPNSDGAIIVGNL
jgi:hypothetical protein